MDTHYLNYILTIAEKRNMTKAAQELFVSQSSLSQYLSKLEQELGTPLFLRAKGELVPTAAGDLYISAAKQVISIKNQLYKDISALENKGNITIGTTSQFGLGIMAQVIPKFRIEYPDYTIEITESSNQALVKLLLDGQIDFGLMAANRIDVFPEGTAEVLREDGGVFPGLYAAGEAAGGLHGRNQLGGCGLADAFVFGKIAGEKVARG